MRAAAQLPPRRPFRGPSCGETSLSMLLSARCCQSPHALTLLLLLLLLLLPLAARTQTRPRARPRSLALAQIRAAIADCEAYHIYPDPGSTALRAALAGFLAVPGVGAEHLCCGCGSDELLDLLVRLVAPTAIMNLPPTFGMYPFLAKLAAVPVLALERGPAPAFRLDLAAAAAVRAGATLIFAASPNNPTGGMLSHEEVRALCSLRAIVVVDEAYAEFAPRERSAAALVPELSNLVVLRTFSKWAGLAGLRVGYSISHAAVAAALAATKQPYNVNVAADVAARAALRAAPAIMARQVAPMLEQRARMVAALDATGWLVPVPSDANFVLFEVRPPIPAAALHAALRRRGVLTRYYSGGRLRGYIRISTGRPLDIDRLLAALDAAQEELQAAHGAVLLRKRTDVALFDMDGVLVSVGGSYREAIVRTARAFDAEGEARGGSRGGRRLSLPFPLSFSRALCCDQAPPPSLPPPHLQ